MGISKYVVYEPGTEVYIKMKVDKVIIEDDNIPKYELYCDESCNSILCTSENILDMEALVERAKEEAKKENLDSFIYGK